MDTKKLRQKILDLAIHGKLVPQDSNDEPASVFLERIRAEKERLIKEGKIKRSRKSTKSSDTPHYEQMPLKLPQGWVWTTLGEIASSILYGVSESAKNKGAYRLLRITDIQNNKVKWQTVPFTDYDDSKAQAYLLKNGDILFARTGATVGKSYLVGDISEPSIYASYLIRLRMPAAIPPSYIKFFFESDFYWEQISINSVGIGQPNVNGTALANLSIPLPPLAEQTRIVAEIERWFAFIDTIEQGKESLQTAIKQAKSKILDLAIHGKLVPQDPNDEPASELLKRINPKAEITCDNRHYPQLPAGWVITSMQNVCNLGNGEKKYNNEMINLDVKYLRGMSAGNMIKTGKYIPAESLLILVDGENSGEVFRTPTEGYQGSTFKQLHINKNMDEEYVLYIINLHRKTLRENKIGSAIPHLNKKLFKAIEVPIPPYQEQTRIASAINATYQILDTIEESL
ncbi:restriction endonuclease subunit S [Prevotella veroralis]|uniref:restriction endonuclease subunit S n=2 Tax=Prevotella veroralis TaxID=28137 RepID=UPI00037D21F0|nr:restriction endonuclease subunit S [Prevotella veroralis]